MSKKIARNIFYAISFTILLVGFIYLGTRDFNAEVNELSDNEKFALEYDAVDKNNVFVYARLTKILELMKEDAVIFICKTDSPWCNPYAKILNEVAIDAGIDKIYYLDIRQDYLQRSRKYLELVDLLDDYLYRDDEDVSHLYVPELVLVKNGKIIGHDNETAISVGKENAENYWSVEKIISYKEKMKNLFEMYLGK